MSPCDRRAPPGALVRSTVALASLAGELLALASQANTDSVRRTLTQAAAAISEGIATTASGNGGTPLTPGPVLTHDEASSYLRLSPRALQDRADIPRADISPPDSSRAQWRYRREDLDAFVAKRLVNPWPVEAR